MEKKRYTYNLAPALPNEVLDTNFNRMDRWERANNMKMSQLTREEWLDVVKVILCLTIWEAEEYLNHLQSMM